jgi:Cu/Ag efflux protein CusF
MKTMNPATRIAILTLFLAGAWPPGAGAEATAPVRVAAAPTHSGEGTVEEINAKEKKIKLAHGPIPSLRWGAMSMFFDVADAALLRGLKPGDKVRFELRQEQSGRFVIGAITKR